MPEPNHGRPLPPSRLGKKNPPSPYTQATELQRLLMDDARKPEIKPLVRAGIARAFCELEETKRKLKMRPLPKAVDVQSYPRSGKNRMGFGSGLDVSDKESL